MNKGVKLLLAVIVLGVLVVAWLGVRGMSDSPELPEETTTYLFVVQTDPAMLTHIEYVVGDESVQFEYKDGAWINPADPYMPLNQTTVGTIASALTTVACNRLISADGNESAEYGLDDPSNRIALRYNDGSTVEYYIGLQNKHTSEYYLSVKGSTAVYSVNPAILDYCSDGYEDMLVLDKVEDIAADSVNKLVSESANGTVTLEKLTRTEASQNENGETVEAEVTYYVLTNEAGNAVELDAETGDKIVKGALAPIVLGNVDFHAEEAELQNYGLIAPTKLTVHYTEELNVSTENSSAGKVQTPMTYVISFGFVKNDEGKTEVYMQLAGSDMVFSVDVSAFESLF